MHAHRSPTMIVLYDHACPLCRTEIMKMKAHDEGLKGKHVLKLIDISAPGFDAHAWGFAPEALRAALHVRDTAGHWHMGMGAIRLLHKTLGLGWLIQATGWPGVRAQFDRAYDSLARNRFVVSHFLGRYLGYKIAPLQCANDDCCRPADLTPTK
jgi:predicted DCC family thiol-disulfide oxidoreductase YuxK